MSCFSKIINFKNLILIGLILFFSGNATSQTVAKIPFIFNGHILVPMKVNDKIELNFMLDTGFTQDIFTLTHSELVEELGLKLEGDPIPIRGGIGNQKITQIYMLKGLKFTHGNIKFENQNSMLIDESRKESYYNFDGAVGSLIFKNYTVEIDFDNSMLNLYEPGSYKPEGEWAEIPLILKNNAVGVNAKLNIIGGEKIPIFLIIDTGGRPNVLLFKKSSQNIMPPENSIHTLGGIGVRGEVFGNVGRIQDLTFGPFVIKSIPTLFISINENPGLSRLCDGILGLGTLYRFNQVYDYANKRLYVKPNKYFSDPFDLNMAGLHIIIKNNGDKFIVYVDDNSPGSEKGLRKGDKIISINGKNAADYNPYEVHKIFTQEGKTLKLIIERDSNRIEVNIKLKRIL